MPLSLSSLAISVLGKPFDRKRRPFWEDAAVSFSEFGVKWSTCLNTLCLLSCARVDSLYAGRNGLIYLVDSHDGKVLVFSESRSR